MKSLCALISLVAFCAHSQTAFSQVTDGLDGVRKAVEQMDTAKSVTYTTIDISEVKTWLLEFPDGQIARGRVVTFRPNTHCIETLSGSLLVQQQHHQFVIAKKKTCDHLSGQIAELSGQINYQTEHIRHSAAAGHSVSPAPLRQMMDQRNKIQRELSSEAAHLTKMMSDHKLITEPASQRFEQLLNGYMKAFTFIHQAPNQELLRICDFLEPIAVKDSGYAEAMLYVYTTIRAGRAPQELCDILLHHKETLQSSDAFGLSPINMSRITLSIQCESKEDLGKTIAYVKRSRESLKSPAITYTLGTWHESKDQWSEAVRYFRMARAKLKDDPRNKAIAAADVIYCQWRQGKFSALSDNREMADEVLAAAPSDASVVANDWQVCRGLAVLSLVNGDTKTATRYVEQAIACAPPRIQRVLHELEDVFRGKRTLAGRSLFPPGRGLIAIFRAPPRRGSWGEAEMPQTRAA